jgi:hypothetical protein
MSKTTADQADLGRALVASRQRAAHMLGDLHVGTVNKSRRSRGIFFKLFPGLASG